MVLDGRLWIRRVFDDRTPPEQGVLVDPALAQIDWNAEQAGYGKATYRALTPGPLGRFGDGRWFARAHPGGDGAATELVPPPPVRDYAPIESELDGALRELGPVEVLQALAGGCARDPARAGAHPTRRTDPGRVAHRDAAIRSSEDWIDSGSRWMKPAVSPSAIARIRSWSA